MVHASMVVYDKKGFEVTPGGHNKENICFLLIFFLFRGTTSIRHFLDLYRTQSIIFDLIDTWEIPWAPGPGGHNDWKQV